METHKDYQERLPEHPEPLELTAHEEEKVAAAPIAEGTEPVVTPPVSTGHGMGSLGWAGLAALAIAVLIGSIYFFSYRSQHDPTQIGQLEASAVTPGNNLKSGKYIKVKRAGDGNIAAASTASNAQNTSATSGDDVVYLFPLDGSEIPEDAVLNNLAAKVSKSGAYVAVVAYTDESGNAAYNQRLSERRAKRVGDYLIAHGVPANHVKTEGLGQTHAYPTAAQDRRAEIHVTYQQ